MPDMIYAARTAKPDRKDFMMQLPPWDRLPENFRTQAVRPYYEILSKKANELLAKRVVDVILASLLIVLLAPIMLIVSVWVYVDDRGPIMFRQIRVTKMAKEFRIIKFRTMAVNAEQIGAQVTTSADSRVTRAGTIMRRFRIDEIPQLFNVLVGDMSFVGTRPEVPRYVAHYTDEMLATLLMPAGITSMGSIYYRDEAKLLDDAADAHRVYLEQVLPAKMAYNLDDVKQFSLLRDFRVMFLTVVAVLGIGHQPES